MKTQIALDTLKLNQCIDLLDLVQDYIDIIEVGTPFLLESGYEPVRVLKARYPKLSILADAKIMDAGEFEAEGAFKAGADIVTVLGAAANATIAGALKAAERNKTEVLVDMICVKDIAKRTIELDAMGVNYICCHTGFDEQAAGKNPLAELITINKNITKAKSAVAGGIKLSTIDAIISEGAEIIIVGGGLTNASDPLSTAKSIKEKCRRQQKARLL